MVGEPQERDLNIYRLTAVGSLKKVTYLILPLLWLGCAGRLTSRSSQISVHDLAQWRLLGIGEAEVIPEKQALRLTEGPDSKGVVLLSPEKYGREIVIKFMAKPLQHEGIIVVFLSASAIKGEEIEVPDGYDGSFAFWIAPDASVQSYAYAFHTGYHQPNAFLKRNPGSIELTSAKDIATEEVWYQVEIGRDGSRLWLNIDGKAVIEASDAGQGLPPGHIGLRLRGPGDGSFSCLFKNFVIETLR